MRPAIIGSIFFGANLLAGISATGAALAPFAAVPLITSMHWLPFVIAGGLKVLYDLT